MSSTAVIAIVIAARRRAGGHRLRHRRPPRRRAARRRARSRARRAARTAARCPPPSRSRPSPARRSSGRPSPSAPPPSSRRGRPAPAPWTPPDAETIGFTRRQFFNRSAVTLMGVGLSGFGVACHRLPVAEARRWVRLQDQRPARSTTSTPRSRGPRTPSTSPRPAPGSSSTRRRRCPRPRRSTAAPSSPAWTPGFVALYQKCVHLGCRVPFCETSQWFECPCHGSQYNRVGEKKGGPAPRGLDRFAVTRRRRQPRHRHRQHVARPADRHQHHRPGGRGSALHHLGGGSLSAARQGSTQSIAIVIVVVLTGAWLVYLLWNVRRAGRPEIGSEIELAPNRKEYSTTSSSKGRRLEKFQLIGLGMLAISAVGLPLYWLHEPARQAGAVEDGTARRSPTGARSTSPPPPTVASTAPAATAA